MKQNKTNIEKSRTDLCKVLLQRNKIGERIEALKVALEDDFKENESEWRNGIKTAAGVIYRKPRWNLDAKENVVMED